MVGIGTNKAVSVPNAIVLAGGGKLNVTTREEDKDSATMAGALDTIAPKVELYEADAASEPKSKVN
jgi:hypothetical protein